MRRLLCKLLRCCKKPPLTLLLTIHKGGITLTGIIMDISVHVGNQESFTVSGKDSSGDAEDVVSTGLAFSSSDPHIANVLADPSEPDGMLVQGLAVGSATGTVTYTNADGAIATATLNITVLAKDVTELDFTQVGGEVPIPTSAPTTPAATGAATP